MAGGASPRHMARAVARLFGFMPNEARSVAGSGRAPHAY